MSRTSYYYPSPDSLEMIDAPGECCEGCGELGRIQKAGSLVPMPCDAALEEYGHSEGDVHMHLECAEAVRDEYKRLYESACAAIEAFKQQRAVEDWG
jgi:hypothetical protein